MSKKDDTIVIEIAAFKEKELLKSIRSIGK